MDERLRLDLTPEEREILTDVLWDYVTDLRMEIASTEAQDFREGLKRREAVLKELLVRLGVSEP